MAFPTFPPLRLRLAEYHLYAENGGRPQEITVCIVCRQYVRKRAVAIPNDIEVPKMEVRLEPDAAHNTSFSLILPRGGQRRQRKDNHKLLCCRDFNDSDGIAKLFRDTGGRAVGDLPTK